MGDYATLAQIKARLGDVGSDSDPLLTELAGDASRLIDRFTGRRFDVDAVDVVRLMDGRGSDVLFTPDLASLTAVRVRSGKQQAWRTVPVADVLLQPADRRSEWPALWIEIADEPSGTEAVFPKGDRTVELTGKFGWAAVPSDVKTACIDIAINLFRARGSGVDPSGIDLVGQAPFARAMPALAHRLTEYVRTRSLVA